MVKLLFKHYVATICGAGASGKVGVSLLLGPDSIVIMKESVLLLGLDTTLIRMGSVLAIGTEHFIY